jgi:hypothetical protein
MFDPEHRVSDEDRDRAVQSLRSNLIEGRLTLDEFAERAGLAYSAKVGADLVRVTSDLPVPGPASTPPLRRASRVTMAVFAHLVRGGHMRLRRRTTAVSIFSHVDLDLRHAEIERDRTTLSILAFFGNVDIYVPAGINVDVGGVTIAGHRRTWGRPSGGRIDPAVYIRSLSMFGTVDVWHVSPDMSGGYGKIIRQVKKQQRRGRYGPKQKSLN